MPASLVKAFLPVLLPTIHQIVNRSLLEHHMPKVLREAVVKPLIKKPSLDKENYKNFRPVSNLPYLGKIIEQAAIDQIESHLSVHNLHEPLQSAYTPNHSTETAIIKVTNDILCALDDGQCVYLVLLDLSAAFDTIDHSVFLSRLQEDYGVMGGVVDWMASYLSDRYQSININGTHSDKTELKYGFPQGSKIGPFGFKLYTKPLTSIAHKYNINIHLYADDTQLYISFDPNNSKDAIGRMEACITEIRSWMANNLLKLNDSKTEFMILGSERNIAKVSEQSLSVGDSVVLPSRTVRNIGAMLDRAMTMEVHINATIKSCYAQIRSISKIRKYLLPDSIKSLIHAFVTSRLDTMNSLLYDIPDCLLKKLQKVQHNAARLIVRPKKSSHITPILKDLHWLPIKSRVQYKIILHVFKCLRGQGPAYLTSLLEEYHPARSLRSSCQSLLTKPKTKRKYGDRAFSVAGPTLWNDLPDHLRNSNYSLDVFKKALKTHLFDEYYGKKG